MGHRSAFTCNICQADGGHYKNCTSEEATEQTTTSDIKDQPKQIMPFHSHWEYQKAKENAATMFNKLCTTGLSDSDNTEYVELCERINNYEKQDEI